MTTLAQAFADLLEILDRLEIAFLVGGSVASGTHGLGRQTNDVDILADLGAEDVDEFCAALEGSFYADADTVRRAVGNGRSFNIIHLKGALKFDIFVAGSDRFARSELARRRYARTSITGLEEIEFPVASAEDTILAKLVWYRRGHETSERQWHDVLGVIRTQKSRLDSGYLTHWAVDLGVSDLLEQALQSGT